MYCFHEGETNGGPWVPGHGHAARNDNAHLLRSRHSGSQVSTERIAVRLEMAYQEVSCKRVMADRGRYALQKPWQQIGTCPVTEACTLLQDLAHGI